MSIAIAQYLHTRWAADETLNSLMDASVVTTGIYFQSEPGSRFATITLPGGAYRQRFNDGSALTERLVRIQVHHDNYDLGLQIADAVMSAFNLSEFDLSGSDRVINMHADGPPAELQDPGTGEWDWIVDFTAVTHVVTGV